MQYLGGKWKAGAEYAKRIAPQGAWWEPFCGALNVSMHLAVFPQLGLVSDVNSELVDLFLAVREGWEPPTEVSREQWQEAKASTVSSFLRTFIGFGCSSSGVWFGSYATPGTCTDPSAGQTQTRNYAAQFAKALKLQVQATAHCDLRAMSFFDLEPQLGLFEVIYCDPPYDSTMGYREPFKTRDFWNRCVEWAATGTRVIVSEYVCPVPAFCLWQRERKSQLGKRTVRVEGLFQVLG